MDKNKNYSNLKKFSQNLGIDLFGVADISKIKDEFELSKKVIAKLDKSICLGLRLSSSILEEIVEAPTRLYFHHYRTVNALLDQSALKLSNYIQQKGYLALPIPASQITDWQNQRAHLSHKKLGVLAGLGWIGRSNLLVNKKIGSQFRLVSVLTNMPVKLDKPVKEDCANCRLCVAVCPAKAIKDNPKDFAHSSCFDKLREFQKQRLVDQFICGVCVNVCKGKRGK
jgi:epoxyqueuosine reductase QueG